MSYWSTFIYDAALNGVPFILINPNNKFNYQKWRLSHYPFIVKNSSELLETIKLIESGDKNISEMMKIFLYVSLGHNQSTSIKSLESLILNKQ